MTIASEARESRTPRLRIGLLFGGKSAEHEISVVSAQNVYQAIDKARYDVVLIRIDREGHWHYESDARRFLDDSALESDYPVFLSPTGKLLAKNRVWELDVVFPILHGANGEDGTIQGLLHTVDIPFVGADVLGCAVGMDKDVTKRLLRDAGLPIPRFRVLSRQNQRVVTFDELATELGTPFFLKPANTGSSVGISKVADSRIFAEGLEHALRFDHKVLAEEYIRGREIECAVIGNETPAVSVPGEIVTQHDFYSYEAKYLDEKATLLKIPAPVTASVSERLRALSVRVYQTLCCEGMARVDWFLDENEQIFANEINTIPGFTRHSMFPLLWEHTGIGFTELIDKLIALALRRYERDGELRTTR